MSINFIFFAILGWNRKEILQFLKGLALSKPMPNPYKKIKKWRKSGEAIRHYFGITTQQVTALFFDSPLFSCIRLFARLYLFKY